MDKTKYNRDEETHQQIIKITSDVHQLIAPQILLICPDEPVSGSITPFSASNFCSTCCQVRMV
jgi:hypothetical protein